MMNQFLEARLLPALRRQRRWHLTLRMTIWWALAALSGLVWFRSADPLPSWAVPVWVMTSVLGAAVVWFIWLLTEPDYRALARGIEARHPALDGRLVTAVQVEDVGKPMYIKERLLKETMQHSVEHEWSSVVSRRAILGTRAGCVVACLAFLAVLIVSPRAVPEAAPVVQESVSLPGGIEVTPGDVELEKGSSLVVLVRFAETPPTTVDLVMGNTPETERRVPLTRSLNDPIFGGSVPDVAEDFRYRIDHDGQRTRDFAVKVFEYPRLERSDVTLTYPTWTGLQPKRIEDSRRVSAVEGTRLGLDLQLNKPVASASLKPREKGAAAIPLTVDPAKAVAALADFPLAASKVYDLVLTDPQGRVNKTPATFTIDVLPNKVPEVRLAAPRGDQRPSALEEMNFTGTAWDDFGVLAWGMAFARGGADPEFIELGKNVPGGETRPFQHVLRLEEMKAKPDDLFSWFVWADDIGPDGKPRRTQGDLFFGEVRAFEQVFRQGEQAPGGQSPPPGGQQGAGAGAKLAELQKQVINATWKLKRTAPPEPTDAFRKDVTVVKDSQVEALGLAEEASGEVQNPRLAAAWETAKGEMTKARDALQSALETPTSLTEALASEQTTYQALLVVRAREYQVSRGQPNSAGQSSAEQQMQEELDQMDLTEEKNRYELEREAEAPQEAERREQRQVLNRLQELARRQEEVNKRLKELQTALQAAQSEEQREDLKRELKRLETEQREMLADVDELDQRMQKPENQERMAQEKQRLEEARQNVQQASEAAAEGKVAQALASGTRAEREFKEMREDMRKKSSSAFSEELREMRAEARDLASRQQKVSEQLQKLEKPAQKTLGDNPEREASLRTLAEQKQRTEQLTKKATELSEGAESAEPLVSRQLYDTMRKFAQDDAAGVKEMVQQMQPEMIREGRMTNWLYQEMREIQEKTDGAKSLRLTSGLVQQDMLPEAKASGQLAQAGIDELKSGIERAAESVLGDDTEALKRADRELDELTRQLEDEIAAATGTKPAGERGPAQDGTSPGALAEGQGARQGQPGENQPTDREATQPGGAGGKPGELAQREPGNPPPRGQGQEGEGQQPGEGQPGQGQAGEGQQPGQGQQPGAGQGQAGRGQAGEGQQPGEGQPGEGQPGEGQAGQGQAGRGQAGRGQAGQGQAGQGQGGGAQEPGEGQPGEGQPGSRNRNGRGGATAGGGRGGSAAPIAGEGFGPWSDRLRDVEEMVDFPELRNGIAGARERARLMRLEMRRDLKKPDWAVVKGEIMSPLVEVRQGLREELARRASSEALVPIDRDPVPGRFSEQVRRYYEQLGKDQ